MAMRACKNIRLDNFYQYTVDIVGVTADDVCFKGRGGVECLQSVKPINDSKNRRALLQRRLTSRN